MYMNTLRLPAMPSFRDSSVGSLNRDTAGAPQRQAAPPPSDAQFRGLRAAYGHSGGLARGDDLARLLEDRQQGDFVSLAKVLVGRKVFGFKWHEQLWIPMFQFELRDLSIKTLHRPVLAELTPVFDNWSLADWFARPNSWLCNQSPVQVLGSNLPAVLAAARADRFIASG
ncbi:MAG: hypothetical protein Q8R33_25295 [Burkholderiales bacterium]|nr:hypothetical protein [Burkholderiales bacterium]